MEDSTKRAMLYYLAAAALGAAVDWNLRPQAGRPCILVVFTPIPGEE